ncbi:MAG: hypothetical protein LBV80_00200 [Deltaproteobacteria bacterium]|nr:hypothetical protein [Deltaproteobacteria bacterium]
MKTKNARLLAPLFGLLLLTLFSTGCAEMFGSGSGDTTASGEVTAVPVAEYYYGTFDDVPLPVEMQPTKEGYVVRTTGNVKLGLQTYSGRVEIKSLNRAMHDYMLRDGWALYSESQGPKETVMVFNKDARLCVIITEDGAVNTAMRINVTQKL